MMDADWDAEERELVADYLATGLVARTYMGYSTCRVCGRQNGDLELTDGAYVWPSGFGHYVRDHLVRPPARFVSHVLGSIEAIEGASRDLDWWKSFGAEGH